MVAVTVCGSEPVPKQAHCIATATICVSVAANVLRKNIQTNKMCSPYFNNVSLLHAIQLCTYFYGIVVKRVLYWPMGNLDLC